MEIKNINTKCDVCGNDILVDKYGNGECNICGWRQSYESFSHPNIAGIKNIPSLNSARHQFAVGKSAILANFDDFISAFENYGELEFRYNNIRYGVLLDDVSNKVILLNIKTNKKQSYLDIDDFSQNARIDSVLLKTLWNQVSHTDFLQDT